MPQDPIFHFRPLWALVALGALSASCSVHDPILRPFVFLPDTPFTQEIAADEPVGHWRLDGAAEGALHDEIDGAVAFGGKTSRTLGQEGFGGTGTTVEMWFKDVRRGVLFSYYKGKKPALVLSCEHKNLNVLLFDEVLDTGIECHTEGQWRHLAVAWESSTGEVWASIDGLVVWRGDAGLGQQLPFGGRAVLGHHRPCEGECEALIGVLDEVVIYERALHPSRILSHVLVALGHRAPSPVGLDKRRAQPQFGHTGAIDALAFSPDGTLLASGGTEGKIKLWDTHTNTLIHDLAVDTNVSALTFSPDGRLLATASDTVNLWDVRTGKLTLTLDDHSDHAHLLAFSLDGRTLAVGTNKLTRWDTRTGEPRGSTIEARALAFDHRAGRAVTSQGDTTTVWDLGTGAVVQTLALPSEDLSVVFSPQRDRLAATTQGAISIWDLLTGERLHNIATNEREAHLTFSPDGRLLATSSPDGAIALWDVRTGELDHYTAKHYEAAHLLAFSPDSKLLVSASRSGLVRWWDLERERVHSEELNREGPVRVLAFSPTGRLITGGSVGDFKVWDTHTNRPPTSLALEANVSETLSFSPDGHWLASGSRDGSIALWDALTGELTHTLQTDNRVVTMEFSPTGDDLITMSVTKTLQVWDPNTGELRHDLTDHASGIGALRFNPQGTVLAAAGREGLLRFWETTWWTRNYEVLADAKRVHAMDFSPDESMLAAAGEDKHVYLWATRTGKLYYELTGHKAPVTKVIFDHHTRIVASGDESGHVRVTHIGNLQPHYTLQSTGKGAITALAFDPDENMFLSADESGIIDLWHLDSGRHLRTLKFSSRPAIAVTFARQGHAVAAVSEKGHIKLWDAYKGTLLRFERIRESSQTRRPGVTAKVWRAYKAAARKTQHESTIELDHATFSDDGLALAVISTTGYITLHDIDEGGPLAFEIVHNEEVDALAFSPDRTRLGVANNLGEVKVYDLQTRDLLARPSLKDEGYDTGALSPDGKLLALSDTGGTVKLWQADKGKFLWEMGRHEQEISALSFRPDSRAVVSVGIDGSVKVWNPKTGLLSFDTEPGLEDVASWVGYSPDNALLAAGSWGGVLKLWDGETGELVHILHDPLDRNHSHSIATAAFSHDHTSLATGDRQGHVWVWDTALGTRRHILTGHTGKITAMAFSPDGQQLAVGDESGNLKVWDSQSGQTLYTRPLTSQAVHDLRYSQDGKRLAAAGWTVKIWEADTGTPIFAAPYLETFHQATRIAFGTEDLTIVAGDTFGHLRRWDIATGREYPTPPAPTLDVPGRPVFSADCRRAAAWIDDHAAAWDTLTGKGLAMSKPFKSDAGRVAFSPDGALMAAAEGDGAVKIWNLRNGARLSEIQLRTSQAEVLMFDPSGKIIAAGGRDGEVGLWRATSGEQVAGLGPHEGGVEAAWFSPDGARITALAGNGTASVWQIEGTHRLSQRTFDKTSTFDEATVSLDGSRAALLDRRSIIELWHPETGKTSTIRQPGGATHNIAFSPDGHTLATADAHGWIRLWDTGSGEERIKGGVRQHNHHITTMTFSPDGRLLATSSPDGTIALLSIPREDQIGRKATQRLSLMRDQDRWLAYNNKTHFAASPDGASLVAMVQGLNAFGIDQLALTHNRPDELIAFLGGHTFDPEAHLSEPFKSRFLDNSARAGVTLDDFRARAERLQHIQEHFKARYLKRLEKADLKEEDASLNRFDHPRVHIINTRDVGEGILEVQAVMRDKRGLKHYQLYVNDVPLLDVKKPLSGKYARIAERLPLTRGMNKIEVTAVNIRGLESDRALVEIEHEGQHPSRVFFVGFGVSDYKNNDQLPDLQYAHQDVLDLAEAFSAHPDAEVHTFINDEVTPNAIKEARGILDKASVHDAVVLFVAGHGVRDEDEAHTYYYLTHGADLTDLPGTAVNFDEIESLLYDSQPRRKLFLMDTCQSGEMDDVTTSSTQTEGARGLKPRAVPMKRRTAKAFGGPQKKPDLTDLSRERFIYVDLARRSGAIVLSSSRGQEFSLEGPEYENGVFTEELLNALRTRIADTDNNGRVSTDELRRHTIEAVPKLTDGRQHPTVDRDNIYQKFDFPILSPRP